MGREMNKMAFKLINNKKLIIDLIKEAKKHIKIVVFQLTDINLLNL
jgi:hypothetical protein